LVHLFTPKQGFSKDLGIRRRIHVSEHGS